MRACLCGTAVALAICFVSVPAVSDVGEVGFSLSVADYRAIEEAESHPREVTFAWAVDFDNLGDTAVRFHYLGERREARGRAKVRARILRFDSVTGETTTETLRFGGRMRMGRIQACGRSRRTLAVGDVIELVVRFKRMRPLERGDRFSVAATTSALDPAIPSACD